MLYCDGIVPWASDPSNLAISITKGFRRCNVVCERVSGSSTVHLDALNKAHAVLP